MINDREAGQDTQGTEEDTSTPPRPRPWHFYARGRYIGTVHEILTEADIRTMYPYAEVLPIGRTVDIWHPLIRPDVERPAREYDTLGPRDPRD